MLPLVDLTQEEIDQIVERCAGREQPTCRTSTRWRRLQEGILFHHLMGGEGDPYLLAVQLSFDSRERLDAYVEALQAVIERHDILRTAVAVGRTAGAGAGGVARSRHCRWKRWNWIRRPAMWPSSCMRASIRASTGSMYARRRCCGLYIAEDEEQERWLMLLLLHHLAGDHTTLEVMQEEIQAHLLGRAEQLPAPLPFRNLVAQARLGVSPEEHEAFFRQMLGDVEEPTAPFGLLDVQGDGTGIEEARIAAGGGCWRADAGERAQAGGECSQSVSPGLGAGVGAGIGTRRCGVRHGAVRTHAGRRGCRPGDGPVHQYAAGSDPDRRGGSGGQRTAHAQAAQRFDAA